MNESLKQIERGLDRSWIDLSARVRELATDLKLKAAGSDLAQDADHLSQETSRLCDHVEFLHADVIHLLANFDSHIPIIEDDPGPSVKTTDADPDEVEKEAILIQREHHELRKDFKDILKALFMWRDDPVERSREKQ